MPRSLRLHRLTVAALLIGTALLVGCERTPAGRLQLALVPESIMTDMGTQAFADMRQQRPLVQHGTTPARVRCVLDRITDQVAAVYPEARAPAEWQIAVFDDASPNAFALPGGHVGVHSGLLNVASNNAQLAAVLGHEVAHMLADHGNERMTQKLGVNAVLLLIGLFADIDSAMVFQALGIGAELGITLPFSRAHEREADLMGLELMAAAGFDPAESVALWRNMARAGGDQPPEFLSTHPAHDNRIESLQAHLPAANRRFADAAIADCQWNHVLPLQFEDGENAESLGLDGKESYSFEGLSKGAKTVQVKSEKADGNTIEFEARVRIDTPKEWDYYQNGGILHYVLRQLAKAA